MDKNYILLIIFVIVTLYIYYRNSYYNKIIDQFNWITKRTLKLKL